MIRIKMAVFYYEEAFKFYLLIIYFYCFMYGGCDCFHACATNKERHALQYMRKTRLGEGGWKLVCMRAERKSCMGHPGMDATPIFQRCQKEGGIRYSMPVQRKVPGTLYSRIHSYSSISLFCEQLKEYFWVTALIVVEIMSVAWPSCAIDHCTCNCITRLIDY